MLDIIIPALNTQLETLKYFEQRFELAEQITDGNGKVQPKIYCAKGQLDSINLDNKNGVSYWRKTDPVTVTTVDEEQLVACLDYYQFTFPLFLIGAVPKEKLIKDDSYSEDRMIITIIKALAETGLKTALKAKQVDVNPSGYETNNVKVLTQEYSSVDNINYNLAYFSLRIDIVVLIRQDCIIGECD